MQKPLGQRKQTVGKKANQEWLTSLAGGLIHEIKNPLSTLNINLQLLKEDLSGAEGTWQKRSLRRIEILQAQAKRLEAILNDFLQFCKSDRLFFDACDLNGIVEEVLKFYETESRLKNVQIRRDLDPSIPALHADSERLQQALMNLLLNGLQAMPEGGELIVRTSRIDNEVILEITDTG